MISIKQEQIIKYPNEEIPDVVYIQKQQQKPNINKFDNQLYQRFPWLQFKNKQLRNKYIYCGRDTQQYHPFYVRFNITQQYPQLPLSELHKEINEKLKFNVDAILDPQIFKSNKSKCQKSIDSINKIKQQAIYSYDRFSTHYGYLLTGIAKPSIKANDIFDTLFLRNLKSNQTIPHICHNKGISNEYNSAIGDSDTQSTRYAVYNKIKLWWDYKLHSYQYYVFMSKAYKDISQQIRKNIRQDLFNDKKQLEQQIRHLTIQQLFNKTSARKLTYFTTQDNGHQLFINDEDYYAYFAYIFANYYQSILQLQSIAQPKDQSEPRCYRLPIKHQNETKDHLLYEYDYQQDLSSKFKNIDLSKDSLNRMIKSNRKRDKKILSQFKFKTNNKRIQQIKKLQNKNKSIFHNIQLLSLNYEKINQVQVGQDGNFIILIKRDQQYNNINNCFFKDIITKRIQLKAEISQKATYQELHLKINKAKIFYQIHKYHQQQSEYSLVSHLSYDPAHLIYQADGTIHTQIEHALLKQLCLNRLPLTSQQQLLMSTPSNQINIYAEMESLIEYYFQCKKTNKLQQFCKEISNQKGFTFQICNIDHKDNEIQNQSIIKIKSKILSISLAEYESTHGNHCLSYIHKQQKHNLNEVYSCLQSDHYAQLRQYLLILLKQTEIIKQIKLDTKQQNNNDQNIYNIHSITNYYNRNWKQYDNYIEYNKNRKYYRIIHQLQYRKLIIQYFQQLITNTKDKLTDIVKVLFKNYLILELYQARIVFTNSTRPDLQSDWYEQLTIIKDNIDKIIKQQKNEGKDSYIPQWVNTNPKLNQIKSGIKDIQKQLKGCKQLLKSVDSSVSIGRLKNDKVGLQEKMRDLKNYQILLFSCIFNEISRYEYNQKQIDNLLKILIIICSHLPSFQSQEIFRYSFQDLDLPSKEGKVYKYKKIILIEISNYLQNKYIHK